MIYPVCLSISVLLISLNVIAATDDPLSQIRRQLESSDEGNRIQAAIQAQDYKQYAKDLIPELFDALTKEKSSLVKSALVGAVIVLGPMPSDLPAILRALIDEDDPGVRNRLLYAVRKLQPESQTVIPALLTMIEFGTEDARSAAAAAVTEFGESVIPYVVDAFKRQSQNPDRRLNLVDAIPYDPSRFDHTEELLKVLANTVVIAETKTSEEQEQVLYAIAILGSYESKGRVVIPRLLELIHSESPEIRWQAAFSLHQIDPHLESPIPVAIEALLAGSWINQMVALDLLDDLIEYLTDDEVQMLAQVGLYNAAKNNEALLTRVGELMSHLKAPQPAIELITRRWFSDKIDDRYAALLLTAYLTGEVGQKTFFILAMAQSDSDPRIRLEGTDLLVTHRFRNRTSYALRLYENRNLFAPKTPTSWFWICNDAISTVASDN